eukprot:8316796-Alexandrium_andersonii.AAC.1
MTAGRELALVPRPCDAERSVWHTGRVGTATSQGGCGAKHRTYLHRCVRPTKAAQHKLQEA